RLGGWRAARSDKDDVGVAAVAVANLADQRADIGVFQWINRCVDVRAAIAVGIAAEVVADFYRPFRRDCIRRVRLHINARVSPGLIGYSGDDLFAPLAGSRSGADLAAATLNLDIDAEGASGVARLPVIDREIERSVLVSGEFAQTADED